MKTDTPKRITTRTAARMSGLSPSTILRACEAKKIRGFKTPGGHWRLEPDDVREFMRGQETAGPGDKVKVLEGAIRWVVALPGGLSRWQRTELMERAGLS